MLCIIYLVVYLCSRLAETRSLGCIALGQYSSVSARRQGGVLPSNLKSYLSRYGEVTYATFSSILYLISINISIIKDKEKDGT